VAARVRLKLTKRLPVASGIGGGSADAAAALRLLGRLWDVPPASVALAAGLGADVPVCLASRPRRMRGIGEVLEPAPVLPPCGMVLVNPGVPVATADVFRARRGDWSRAAVLPDVWPDVAALVRDLSALRNDLEPAAVALRPIIGEVLAAVAGSAGCRLARMSGSGATCFGLFDDATAAVGAADALRRPGWWSWGGALSGFT
jgi:4-diphosphocytidyl-2-C-methyl-D-erythritol kinase